MCISNNINLQELINHFSTSTMLRLQNKDNHFPFSNYSSNTIEDHSIELKERERSITYSNQTLR